MISPLHCANYMDMDGVDRMYACPPTVVSMLLKFLPVEVNGMLKAVIKLDDIGRCASQG